MNTLLKNPLLKKEIRLLLPALGLTLLLVFASVFFFSEHGDPKDVINNFTPVWLGVMILCASSFGREFSLGTFSSLLAQPFPRKQYWITKVGVLAAALVSVLVIYSLLVYPSVAVMDWHAGAWLMVLLLTAVAGGLWMALLVRQMMAVVWLVALIPGILCVPFLLVLSHFEAADETTEVTVYVLLLIYSIAGIAGSWLIFRGAQDAPWSGGTIGLPEWMTARIMPRSAGEDRLRVPWRALIRKELHFNQVLLFGMAGLFFLDLCEVGIRFLWRDSPGDFNSVLEAMGILLWLLVPLIIGCTSIAEERKLGTMEGQLCQPVSTRRQFIVKLAFTLIFGGLLGTFFPMVTERLALAVGATHDLLPDATALAFMTAGMCALALIGFYASSLSRNVLHALPIAVGMYVGISLVFSGFIHLSGLSAVTWTDGFVLWSPFLPNLILAGLLPAVLVWLAYRNFRCLPEATAIWRRNSLGLAAVLVFTVVASLAIYHRAWEKLAPFEPAHGVARWTMSDHPVAIRTDLGYNLLISLPDGRYWFGCMTESQPDTIHNEVLHELLPPLTSPRLKVGQFITDSNWVSLAAGYVDIWMDSDRKTNVEAAPQFQHFVDSRETVGIRPDGTLWVSEKATGPDWNTSPLVQFGTETDWRQVLGDRSLSSVLLLKKNGTLWRWGDRSGSWYKLPPHWEGLRAQTPRQIGTDSDWQSLVQLGGAAAQKMDGSLWNIRFNAKDRRDDLILNTNFDQAGFVGRNLDAQKWAGGYNSISAGIHPDGTLWIWGDDLYSNSAQKNKFAVLQSNQDTNWLAVALSGNLMKMIALKSGGTLWCWSARGQYADTFTSPPKRLGTHGDWVALAQTWLGVISLAADGSLWLWPDSGDYYDSGIRLLEPPQKPIPLGNVLAAN